MANPFSTRLAAVAQRAQSAVAPRPAAGTIPGTQPENQRTQTFTLFTDVGVVRQIADASRRWIRVRLLLETAGPVVIGTNSALLPVTTGTGILLPTGREYDVVLAYGDRLFYAADALNRVSITIEALPWLEQISAGIGAIVDLFRKGA